MRLTWSIQAFVAGARGGFRCRDAALRRSVPFRVETNLVHRRSFVPSSWRIVQHRHRYDLDNSTTLQGRKLSSLSHTAESVQPYPLQASLPVTCPGCGALSQVTSPDAAGHYSRSRKAVKAFLRDQRTQPEIVTEEQTAELERHEGDLNEQPGAKDVSVVTNNAEPVQKATAVTPVCDRCHDLVYNSKGQSIAHPSVQDIADSIAESPFKRNHVYHVLDAADFPMSLFPKVFHSLELAKPRSQNRRSRHKFSTRPSVSFIITRSDLLAPAKEMVDKMLPYFQAILRTALGKVGRDMRLGNVHLVSAKRGWWTKDIKDDIWDRGGGNWMVGRVNVGKSNLFEVLFPKGSGERAPVYSDLKAIQHDEDNGSTSSENAERLHHEMLSENSLLPPAQPETLFPAMPIVSSLPGTTASPIRLPFGGHRGELIDLPGLERGDLEQYVQSEHKLDLVMQHRPNVKQHIIKPGQSLLLGGGLIRITPRLDPNDPSTTMLAYPFVPIEAHVTSTEKATSAQLQLHESGIGTILADGVGDKMATAGTFQLKSDVTKARSGPLIRAGVPATRLSFKVYSTDILIEGVGWVELVCQVRKSRHAWPAQSDSPFSPGVATAPTTSGATLDETTHTSDLITQNPNSSFKPFALQSPTTVETTRDSSRTPNETFAIPQVEIFSPHGRHVAQRPPLGAWIAWDEGRRRKARSLQTPRTRKPMSGRKKQEQKRTRN